MHEEKARLDLHENAMSYFEQILEATPHKTAAVQPLTSHLKNHTGKTNKMWDAAGEARTNYSVTFFYGPLYMDGPGLVGQQELTSALCGHWILFGGPAKNNG